MVFEDEFKEFNTIISQFHHFSANILPNDENFVLVAGKLNQAAHLLYNLNIDISENFQEADWPLHWFCFVLFITAGQS